MRNKTVFRGIIVKAWKRTGMDLLRRFGLDLVDLTEFLNNIWRKRKNKGRIGPLGSAHYTKSRDLKSVEIWRRGIRNSACAATVLTSTTATLSWLRARSSTVDPSEESAGPSSFSDVMGSSMMMNPSLVLFYDARGAKSLLIAMTAPVEAPFSASALFLPISLSRADSTTELFRLC